LKRDITALVSDVSCLHWGPSSQYSLEEAVALVAQAHSLSDAEQTELQSHASKRYDWLTGVDDPDQQEMPPEASGSWGLWGG
jgi:hypothetical protein